MGPAGDQLVGDPGAGVDAPPLRDTVGDVGQAVRQFGGQVGRLGGTYSVSTSWAARAIAATGAPCCRSAASAARYIASEVNPI